MHIRSLQENWDNLGRIDAMWAIITEDPSKLGHGWTREAFFATGRAEIDTVLAAVRNAVPDLSDERALDFGCGVGRLARALAPHFRAVVGVDIAPSMIEQARELNADLTNCEWIVNATDDLGVFADGTFSLIYSNVVLQHMRREYALAYMREFVRIARPGGAIVFQLPAERVRSLRKRAAEAVIALGVRFAPRPLIDAYRRRQYPNADDETIRRLPRHVMEMHGTPRELVEQTLRDAGATVIEVTKTSDAGDHWQSLRYIAVKDGSRLRP